MWYIWTVIQHDGPNRLEKELLHQGRGQRLTQEEPEQEEEEPEEEEPEEEEAEAEG